MQIEEQRQGAVTVLRPHGPVSQAEAPALKNAAMDVLGRTLGRFVIDASEIPYVDSAGLECFADITEELGASGQMLKLCAAGETLREILDLTELTGMFEHYEDVGTAVRSFL